MPRNNVDVDVSFAAPQVILRSLYFFPNYDRVEAANVENGGEILIFSGICLGFYLSHLS